MKTQNWPSKAFWQCSNISSKFRKFKLRKAKQIFLHSLNLRNFIEKSNISTTKLSNYTRHIRLAEHYNVIPHFSQIRLTGPEYLNVPLRLCKLAATTIEKNTRDMDSVEGVLTKVLDAVKKRIDDDRRAREFVESLVLAALVHMKLSSI